ncbi:hypothetical protein [Deinococcus sp. QL22]|uniref:hypothetical protein n=1 Tax=Deinococcus sp. QL22 TaxID=2939437 RepID=UPI002016D6B3|nr:hypothetical protein [Deinococcus sp. QL22]UQN08236.1 hypothetical protein M1R55_19355 [Deinococcus sp. QL22]
MTWKSVTTNKLNEGDTIKINGGVTIRIQKVMGRRGSSAEVITAEGLPVEIRDTDDVMRLEKPSRG